MKRVIVCDIDGSLMPGGAGLYVNDVIKEKLIALQEKGNVIILNSARIFQGVYPLANQIEMDRFGGYVISCNGCQIYDMTTQKVIDEYLIDAAQVKWLWDYANQNQMGMAFTQPDYVVCNRMEVGFELDQKNCDVDYIVTNHKERYFHAHAVKCTLASDPDQLSQHFDTVQKQLQEKTDLVLIPSTPELYDIIDKNTSKHTAVEKVLSLLKKDWKDTTVIGDSYGDVESIRLCGLGCTLENAKEECKAVADMIVPSCMEDGCIEWLDRLLEEAYEDH